MAICPRCNHENRDDGKFCASCGFPLMQENSDTIFVNNQAAPVVENAPAAEQPVAAPVMENAPINEQPQAEGFVQNEPQPVMFGVDPYATYAQPPKKKALIICAIASLVVILGVVITGFLTDWFGLLSPLHGLIKAFKNTFEAENLTMNISVEQGDNEADLGLRYDIDIEKEELVVIGTMDDNDNILLYKGDAYNYASDDSYAHIQEQAFDEDEFFEKYKEAKEEQEDIDWEELFEDANLDDYVNGDEFEAFLTELYKEKLCDDEWLAEYLGFKEEDDVYTFKPDLADLSEEIADICDDSNAFTRDAKKAIRNALEADELLDLLEDIDIQLSIKVDGGYISAIDFNLETPDEQEIIITIEFANVGETIISEQEIKEFKNKTQNIIDDHTCNECGEVVFYGEHGDCKECGEHGDIDYDGMCWDCYYYSSDYAGYGYCNRCQDYGATYYSYYDHKLCDYCKDYYNYNSISYGYCFHCGDYGKLYGDDSCYSCW